METEETTESGEANSQAVRAANRQSASSSAKAQSRTKTPGSDRQVNSKQHSKGADSLSDSPGSPAKSGNRENAKKAAATLSESGAESEHNPGIDLSPEIQRAEALLDEFGHRAGGQLTNLARTLLRTAARAREEAEDIWAEANSIRRGHY